MAQHPSNSRQGTPVRRTLISTSALSMALAAHGLLPAPAQAQSAPPPAFQGTFTTVNGGAVRTTGTATVGGNTFPADTISISRDSVVLNWTPSVTSAGSGPIDFLPANFSAVFNRDGTADYTVLNRIIPTGAAAGRGIALNGVIGSFSNGTTVNGNIWFFSPNGVLAGATSGFLVGGLVLTTLDHPFSATDGSLTFGSNGEFQFGAASANLATVAGSSVVVAPGAQIFASFSPASYVALVAPRVEQGGGIIVNGSAALVAAEQADLTFTPSGLFDVKVNIGSSDQNGIVHTGILAGTARTAANPNGQIAMVAVPKNDAITMLVQGAIGYQPATSAAIQNGSVVLSSGFDIGNNGTVSSLRNGDAPASIQIDGPTAISSNLVARASGNFATAFASGESLLLSTTETTTSSIVPLDADIAALGRVDLGLTNAVWRTSGNLSLRAGTQPAGGTIIVTVADAGGTLQTGPFGPAAAAGLIVQGDLLLDAGALSDTPTVRGGNADLALRGANGRLNVGGNLTIRADAIANKPGGLPAPTTNAVAGVATLNLAGGAATLSNLTLSASALGGGTTGVGGSAAGGLATLSVTGGTHSATTISVSAEAQGGAGAFNTNGPGLRGGIGGGGTAIVGASAGNLTANTITIDAGGSGGSGGNTTASLAAGGIGGGGVGGLVTLDGSGGALEALTVSVRADGRGGVGGASLDEDSPGTGGAGGGAVGGEAIVSNVIINDARGSLFVSADADGGNGGLGGTGGAGGEANAGASGIATLTLDRGLPFSVGSVTVSARGNGGDGGDGEILTGLGGAGGRATAGTASLLLSGGSPTATFARVRATATAGDGGFARDGGNGGAALGGSASLEANNGAALTIGALEMDSDAIGGEGASGQSGQVGNQNGGNAGAGGAATGGRSSLLATDVLTSVSIGEMAFSASATGGEGGQGGDGANFTGGGRGGNGGAGGRSVGGSASLTVENGASASILGGPGDTDFTVVARSLGGGSGRAGFGTEGNPGGSAALGAAGIGGQSLLRVDNASLTLNRVSVDASGFGGGGLSFSGVAGSGDGTGGTAEVIIDNGGLTVATLTIDARGTGGIAQSGTSVAGGNGLGGTGRLQVFGSGSSFNVNQVSVQADGRGGNGGSLLSAMGGAGGSGTGGLVDVLFGSTGSVGDLLLSASGQGGRGGFGASGGAGGNGLGGDGNTGGVQLGLESTGFDIGGLALSGSGIGGAGGEGFAGAGGGGGNGTGGSLAINAIGGGITALFSSFNAIAEGIGGSGGNAGTASTGASAGGIGGDGRGGSFALRVEDGASLSLDSLQSLSVTGAGGQGGRGSFGQTGADGSPGVAGTPGVLGVNGGNGGAGGPGGPGGNGGNGGDGGAGGFGFGGGVSLIAANGGTLTAGSFAATVNGVGGAGGVGGGGGRGGVGGIGGNGGKGADDFSGIGTPGNGGNGGAGGAGGIGGQGGTGGTPGAGNGGSFLLSVNAATVDVGDLDIAAGGLNGDFGLPGSGGFGGEAGYGGLGGLRGESGYGAGGLPGTNGTPGQPGGLGSPGFFSNIFNLGSGGQITLEALAGSNPSNFRAGGATLTTSAFGSAGTILIANLGLAGEPQPDMLFSSISANGSGFFDGLIQFRAENASIVAENGIFAETSGDVRVDAIGIGQLRSDGNISLFSNQRFLASHGDRPSEISTILGQQVDINSGNDFEAATGTVIEAQGALFAQSSGANLFASDLRAVNGIRAFAAGDLTIGDATTTGTPSPFTTPVFPGTIDLRAGFIDGIYFPATATITGNITSTGDTLISSGGDIVISGTSSVQSNNRISLISGDDILINDGAALISSIDPIPEFGYGSTGALEMLAGALQSRIVDADEVASLFVGVATLEARDNTITLAGEAISASGARFDGRSLLATVSDAPAPGVVARDDGGLLSGGCLEGDLCIGQVFAIDRIELGAPTGTSGVPNRIEAGNDLVADTIVVRGRDRVLVGASGSGEGIAAGSSLFVASILDNIEIDDSLSIVAPDVRLFAGGAVLGAGAAITADTLGLGGGSVTLGSAALVNPLNTIVDDGSTSIEGTLEVFGSAIFGNLGISAGDIAINAGSDIIINHGFASGNAFLNGFSFQTDANTLITGGDIFVSVVSDALLGNSQAGGSIFVSAGGDIGLGSITSGSLTTLLAGGAIAGTGVTSGASFSANMGNGLTLDTIDSGGDVSITGSGNSRIGSATARASSGQSAFPSEGNIFIINAGDLVLDAADAATMLGVTASNITAAGNWTAGEDVLAASDGTIALGNVSAGDDLDLSAPLGITAGNLLTRGDARDDRAILLDEFGYGSAFAFSAAATPSSVNPFTQFFDITGESPTGADMEVAAGGAVAVQSLVSDSDLTVTGTSISITGNATAGDGLSAVSFAGNTEIGGNVSGSGVALVANNGRLVLGMSGAGRTLTSAGAVNLSGTLGIDLLETYGLQSGDLAISTGGSLNGPSARLRSNGRVLLSVAGSVNLTELSGGEIGNNSGENDLLPVITAGGDFVISDRLATTTGNLDVSAGGNITIGTVAVETESTVSLDAGSVLTVGSIGGAGNGTPSTVTLAGDTVSLETVNGSGAIAVEARNGTLTGGAISGASVELDATGAITTGALAARTGDILANAGSNLGLNGPATAGGRINLASGGELSAGPLTAGSTTTLAGNTVTLQTVDAGGAVSAIARNGALTAGAINGTGVELIAGDAITAAALTASTGDILASAGAGLLIDGPANAGGRIDLASGLGLSAGALTAGGSIALAGETVSLQSVDAGGGVSAIARNGVLSAGAISGAGVELIAGAGITTAALTATTGDLRANAGADLIINGPARAGGGIEFTSGLGLSAGPLTAGNSIFARANGGAMALGNAVAGGNIDLIGLGGLVTAGDLRAGGDVYSFSRGDTRIGSATALGTFTGPRGQEGLSGTAGIYTVGGGLPTSGVAGGHVFAIALGDIQLNQASALGMIGASGRIVAGTGTWTAGEDIKVLARDNVIARPVDSGGQTRAALPTGDVNTISLGTLTAGNSIDLVAADGIEVAGATTSGTARNDREIILNTTQGLLFQIVDLAGDGADIDISSLGGITTGDLRSADDAVLSGSAIAYGSVRSANATRLTATGMLGGGAINAGSVQFSGVSADLGQVTAATTLNGTTTGAMALDGATGGGAVTLNAGSTDFGAVRGGSLAITSGQALSFTQLQSAGAATLSAATGIAGALIDVDGTIAATAGGNIAVTALDLGTGSLTAGGTLAASSLRSTGAITATAPGGITLATTNVGGDLDLSGTAGAIVVSSDLRATGRVNARAQTITLASLGSFTLGTAIASNGALSANARGTIGVDGRAIGGTVDFRSANIAINPTSGSIGAQGTTSVITLSNTGNAVTTIGGNGVGNGYSLSAAEAARLFANDITINAPRVGQQSDAQQPQALTSRAPDVIVDAFTLGAGQGGNLGSNGRLLIQSNGKLRTVGAAAISGLGTGGRFEIQAAEAIEVDAATGSISLRGASGGLGGTLILTSEDVVSATASALAAVTAAADMATINQAMSVSAGINDEGTLRADGIIVNVSRGFYVQNTGSGAASSFSGFEARRGLTVGNGGLRINVSSPLARIAINGRQQNQTGFVTGIDFLRQVSINGFSRGAGTLLSGLFDFDSTINGCQILSPTSCSVSFDEGNITRDIINDTLTKTDDEGGSGGLDALALVSIREVQELGYPPLIDDPVTGAGNDDLWAIDDGSCPDGDPDCQQ